MSYTHDEVYDASLEYFKGDTLQTDIFVNKYALRDNEDNYYELTPDDMWRRVSKEVVRIDKKYKNSILTEDIVFEILKENYICPGGSILFGAGNSYANVSLANCYALPKPEDSMSGIFDTAKNLANISKRRGGVGINISSLRPDGSVVRNAAKTSSGAWSWGKFISDAAEAVGQNNRRAAVLLLLDVSHPDIFKFISMKDNLNNVNGANISVAITDKFMQAVEADADWDLVYDGKVYDTVKAKDLFKQISEHATKTGEPGIIYIDTYANNVPLHFYPTYEMVCTNPCLSGDTEIIRGDALGDLGIGASRVLLKDINIGDSIWSNSGWTKVIGKYNRGIKPLYRYKTYRGYLDATENHKIVSNGEKVEIGKADFIDICDNVQYYAPYVAEYKSKKELGTITSSEYIGDDIVWDITVDNDSHTFYANGFNTSNCGELLLSQFASCILTALNISRFVENGIFNFTKYMKAIKLGVRILDNIVDLEIEAINRLYFTVKTPDEKELYKNILRKLEGSRRIGLGTFGLADALIKMKVKYDSDEALEFVEKISKIRMVTAYHESMTLGDDRGCFPDFDPISDNKCEFIQKLMVTEIQGSMQRRNSAILTDPPTGSIGTMLGVSTGIEPIYDFTHIRKRKINSEENEIPDFTDAKGVKFKYHKVKYAPLQQWIEEHPYEEVPDYFIDANHIDWKKRVELQGLVSENSDGGVSSCLVGDTLINTDKGLFKLEELANNKDVVNEGFSKLCLPKISSINIDNNKSLITQYYKNGLAETKTVLFEGGRDICGTLNHKLCILNSDYNLEWKSIKDITVGDWVVFRRKLRMQNTELSGRTLKYLVGSEFKYEKLTNSKDVSIPNRMTVELARLIGYMCSDGSINSNGVSLSQLPNNVCNDFEQLINKLFGVSCNRSYDLRSEAGLLAVVANSRELRDFFKWIGITNHDVIEVPLCIRRAGIIMQQEFIKGATLDGHTCDNGIVVATSVSLPYLKQLQAMLSNLGIEGVINTNNTEGMLRKFPGNNICVCKASWNIHLGEYYSKKYMEYIGFAEDRKNKEIKSKLNYTHCKCEGSIPDYNLRLKFRDFILPNIKSNKLRDIFHSLTCKDSRNQKWMRRETVREFVDMGLEVPSYLVDDTYDFRAVKSVTNSGLKETYDLSVPDGNSYIANGIISHNTINLPKKTPASVIEEIYTEAWKQGCKGITVYVDECRDGILIRSTVEKEEPYYKRPKELPCDIFHETVQHHKETIPYVIIIGLKDGQPFEVFGGEAINSSLKKSQTHGIIRKKKTAKEGTTYDLVTDDGESWALGEEFNSTVFEPINRLISLDLRDVKETKYVVDQLLKCKKADMFAYAKVVARVLERYIKEDTCSSSSCTNCHQKTVIYQGGCGVCQNCGHSACG